MLERIIRKLKSYRRKERLRKMMFKYQSKRDDIIHLGEGYGAFDVADTVLNDESIVYSFGIGEDLSFSRDIIKRYGCQVFAFDPTPKAIEYVKKNELYQNGKFTFYEYGISSRDEIGKFHLPSESTNVSGSLSNWSGVRGGTIEVMLRTLPSIMKELKHNHIDVLKLDIEGSEFDVIGSLCENNDVQIGQICVEIHDRFFWNGESKFRRMLKQLKLKEYKLVSISESFEELLFVSNSLL